MLSIYGTRSFPEIVKNEKLQCRTNQDSDDVRQTLQLQ